MRPRRSSARWLLLALLTVPGCLFRPIFHPPSATDGDGGIGHDAGENRHQDGSFADASSGIDVPATPRDDCSGFYDQSSGTYAPDAHHVDGAVCSLPSVADAGTSDASVDASAPDVIVTDASDDATDAAGSDATDDTTDAGVSDATDDATDSGIVDDAPPADPDAGE